MTVADDDGGLAKARAVDSRVLGGLQMMRQQWLGLIAILALGATGCGGDSGPTCPASTVNRYDGYWIGHTSAGGDVEVRVVNSVVVSFQAFVRVSSNCSLGIGYGSSPASVITDKQFSFVLPAMWTMPPVEVTGHFDGDRALSGTIGAMSLPAKACGSSPAVTTQAVSFTAEQ
jgi:hypothetical protein